MVTYLSSACRPPAKRPLTCVLPPYPSNGSYEVAGDPAAKPGDFLEYVYLNVSCNHGLGVIGNNVMLCIQGEWSTTMPQCVSVCYLKDHPSETYSCDRLGTKELGPCAEYEPAGTSAEPECRPGYYSPVDMPQMRCVEGNWTYVAQCSAEPVCEWEGLKGKCVEESRCLTTLADNSPKHPVCAKAGGESFICCTDCQLVNNTKNAVIRPTSRLYWKNGQKARDNCLEYLITLPYECKKSYYGWISRDLNAERKCYNYIERDAGGPPSEDVRHSAQYPHQVMLGFGDPLAVNWKAGGFIISDKYIVTAAHVGTSPLAWAPIFLAMGVKHHSDSSQLWQIRRVKRFIYPPQYNRHSHYHDIALIETDTPIKFDENVLPACLHVDEEVSIKDATATTWFDIHSTSRNKFGDTIQTFQLEEFSEEECKDAFGKVRSLNEGYNHKIQMCYGSRTNKTSQNEACLGLSGEPLLVSTQFSSCVHTAIGISSFGYGCRSSADMKPHGYTRIAGYVPWIESIVWP